MSLNKAFSLIGIFFHCVVAMIWANIYQQYIEKQNLITSCAGLFTLHASSIHKSYFNNFALSTMFEKGKVLITCAFIDITDTLSSSLIPDPSSQRRFEDKA